MGSSDLYQVNGRRPVASVNFITAHDGFTMNDLVSYNEKHNEANGEGNRDGESNNRSWNCGVEGPTNIPDVNDLRQRQMRNMFATLLFSQGIPMICGGDEVARTQQGNNNAYCQDNEISWINWGLLKSNQDIYQFTKAAIAFRKKHPVFHMKREPALMDYKSCGLPDVSYHGVKAWYPEFDYFRRQLGILYCGAYGEKADGEPDDYFYVAYNMHWTPQDFALPNLPKELKWHLAVDTAEAEQGGFVEEGKEPVLKDQKKLTVQPRSIVVAMGKAAAESKGKKVKECR